MALTNTVQLTIASCDACPKLQTERCYTGDSFEDIHEWKCTDMGFRRIARHEWNDPKPTIPPWCPLRFSVEPTGKAAKTESCSAVSCDECTELGACTTEETLAERSEKFDLTQSAEPVAWRVETGYTQPAWLYHEGKTAPRGISEPLYTTPQPCPACAEKDAEIERLVIAVADHVTKRGEIAEEIDRLTKELQLAWETNSEKELRAEIERLKASNAALKETLFTNTNREMTLSKRFFTAHEDGFVSDNNFDFDAGLQVSGDFENDEKNRYAQMIACTLNSYSEQAAEIDRLNATIATCPEAFSGTALEPLGLKQPTPLQFGLQIRQRFAEKIDAQAAEIDRLKSVESMRDEEIASVREKHGNALIEIERLKSLGLTVWFGSMPESCGRENWTVMLRRKSAPEGYDKKETHHLLTGFTVCQSEYKDRMRYEADRLRFLLGEIKEGPDILKYDADLRSTYLHPPSKEVSELRAEIEQLRADAERYRWLRNAAKETPLQPKYFNSEICPDMRMKFDFPTLVSYDCVGNQITLDSAIDAAKEGIK